jgi:hypothetical protein
MGDKEFQFGNDALDARRAGVDVVLTKLSIGIAPDQELVGDRLLQALPQKLSHVKLAAYGTEAWRMIDDQVGDFSRARRVDISMGTISIEVDGHALINPVSDRQQQEAQLGPLQFDLEARALYVLKQRQLLRREKLQADLATTVAAYTASHAIDVNAASHLWSDNANDPLIDLFPLIEQTIPDDSGRRPNTIVFGHQVWAKFLQNTFIRNKVYGQVNPGAIPTEAQISSILGIANVLVGRAVSKTEAAVNTKLWGNNVVLAFVPPTAGEEIPGYGYTVEQQIFGDASEAVVRIRDEEMGTSGGWLIKRSALYTPVITFKDAGALLYNCT